MPFFHYGNFLFIPFFPFTYSMENSEEKARLVLLEISSGIQVRRFLEPFQLLKLIQLVGGRQIIFIFSQHKDRLNIGS